MTAAICCFFSCFIMIKKMKLDNDFKERLRVAASFLLESYKICMGCFLSVFVSHNCEDSENECSIAESFAPTSMMNTVTFSVNAITFAAIVSLYTVELMRENYCIEKLDIDPNFPDTNLKRVAPVEIQQQLLVWNNRYWKTALASVILVVSNIALSSVYLARHARGAGTVTTTLSFSLLVLMKLYRSFSMAREDRVNVRARSAYMTEYTSFNILDKDHFPQFNNINGYEADTDFTD